MSSTTISPPPEVKFHDFSVVTAPATSNWTIISSQGPTQIAQGAGTQQRLGCKIKVVGIVARMSVNTDGGGGFYSPYTMDFIWDNQCNGAVPNISEIYGASEATPPPTAASGINLPNPLFDQRFQFITRVKQNNPNSPNTLVDRMMKTSKVIEYRTNTNSIVDLTAANLLITFTAPADATPNISGIVRLLFVDA